MTAEHLTAAVLVIALATSALGWRQRGNRSLALVTLLATATAGIALWITPERDFTQPGERLALVLLVAILAVLGGGPLTAATFRQVDGTRTPVDGSVRGAAEILRGGTWIGALERTAVFAALVSGWPEGLALTLALKGLGRYPELRHEERPGIAERFLIGTFVSVLWACACAGLVRLAG